MQLVYVENNRPVTDSLIVAKTFSKNHKDVLRDIRNLGCSDEFHQRNFAPISYKDNQNRTYTKYLITQDGFAFLVMGYTGKEAARFKEMYINEFNRMRQQLTQPKLPQTYKEALISLLEQIEENEKLQQKIEEDRPKVALYETAMSAKNNYTMEKVAKTLGYGRNKLFAFLREQRIIRPNNLPYQRYLDAGYFAVRQYTVTHFTSGLENKTQTLVTPKGMDYIHRLLVKHGKIPSSSMSVIAK